MARQKNLAKAKEPVRIRFKELSNGNQSIYLDIYRDGKRHYEFLKLYLIPEKSRAAKTQNENTLAAANAIKSKRILEISNNKAGIKNISGKGKISLRDYCEEYLERKSRKGIAENTIRCYKAFFMSLSKFGDDISMIDIDSKYIASYITFLRENYRDKRCKSTRGDVSLGMKESSVKLYYQRLNCILNAAVKEDVIPFNPASKMDSDDKPQSTKSTRTFLTPEELKSMINTPIKNQHVRNQFLFCCFCGLRWSDAVKLTWREIELNNGQPYLNIVMQKTKEALYAPLNSQALSYLPERPEDAKDTDLVFHRIYSEYANKVLKKWAKAAGIDKDISFHVSRHTFATTALTLGADLFTVSKLLGHTDISTTQIYAKIVNSKKVEAVNLFDKAF